MMKSRAINVKNQNENKLSKDEIRYAELGLELNKLNSKLSKENTFLKHLKKLARQNDEEYFENFEPHRMKRKRRGSITKQSSPDVSPTLKGSVRGLKGL